MNTYTYRDAFNLISGSGGLSLVAVLTDDAGADVGGPLAATYADMGHGGYGFKTVLALATAGYIRHYVSGTPGVNVALSVVTPLADSPGVTAIVGAIASGQDGITVVNAESATSLVVSGLNVPVANMANSLIDAILNDVNTGLYKGTARVSSAAVVPSSSNNRILLVPPGLPVCGTGDTIQLRG